jgi:hypothetical protein
MLCGLPADIPVSGRRIIRMLVVVTALLATTNAAAQAHGPVATELQDEPELDTATARAAKLAETAAWLGNMTGRFRLSSAISSDRPGLLVDCVGIGTGPGLQCMRGRGGNTPEGEEVNAEMQLFGLDPLALTVSYLRVNGRGIAQYAQGKVKGDTLVFPRTNCLIPENIRSQMGVVSCEEVLKIRTSASGKEQQFVTETFLRRFIGPPGKPKRLVEQNYSANVWMRRVPQDDVTDMNTALDAQ